jgi:hypothetical protein
VDDVEDIHRYTIPNTARYALAVDFVGNPTNNGADSYGFAYYVPEPTTMAMMLCITSAALLRRRRARG